jgi:sugar porter (SP) family MFS transporter
LRNLTEHKMGFRIAIAAATIGVIYGYDLGAIAGALLFITDDFGLSTKQTEWVATIVVAGSVLGALTGGRLANAIGRKPVMVIVALTYAVFAVLSGVATSLVFLDVARFFLGVTIGISIVTAPIFVAESAPASVRGAMIVMYQVATVTGIVVAYFVDYALAGTESWRLMLALSAVPALGVVVVLARLPDTPRWYVMKGRLEEARDTLRLTDPEADADRELAEIEADLRGERGGSLSEMLRAPYLRATLFVVGLGFLIQITGINAVVFYSPMIFKEMGFTGNASLLLLPALVQVGSLVATLVSLSIVDRLGRRPTLLTGIAAMARRRC